MGRRQENREKEDKMARLYSTRMMAPGAAVLKVQEQLSIELGIPLKTLRQKISRASKRLEPALAELDDDDDDDDDGVAGLPQLRRTEVVLCDKVAASRSRVSKRGASRAEEDRRYELFQTMAVPGMRKCSVVQQLSAQHRVPVDTLRKQIKGL